MFDKIVNHPELLSIVCGSCSENNASVEFDNLLKINGELDDTKVLVLKPDSFYNTKNFAVPPNSPDCLILVNCVDKAHYDLYLIELKDVAKSKGIKRDDIFDKFQEMANDFFVRFSDIFNQVQYGKIELYLISTYPKGAEQLSEDEYNKKIKGSVLDIISSLKPIKLLNHAIFITPRASLTIMPC